LNHLRENRRATRTNRAFKGRMGSHNKGSSTICKHPNTKRTINCQSREALKAIAEKIIFASKIKYDNPKSRNNAKLIISPIAALSDILPSGMVFAYHSVAVNMSRAASSIMAAMRKRE
jgi:hypothetical protein